MYKLVLKGQVIGWGDYETLKAKQAIYCGKIIECRLSVSISRYSEIVDRVLKLDSDKG